MISIDSTEAWKQIPPEEKVELMNRAHSAGFLSAVIWVIVMSTIAVALKIVAIMWVGIITAPVVFQVSAGKSWRDLKPRIMLEYLAARSAARRFAFTEGAKELSLTLIFKGTVAPIFNQQEQLEEAIEAAVQKNREAEVWIALFKDTLVMLAEQPGGATLKFGENIVDRMTVESSDSGGYSQDKELTITVREKSGEVRQVKVGSRYPGCLAVLEKKILQNQTSIKEDKERELARLTQSESEKEDDDFLSSPF